MTMGIMSVKVTSMENPHCQGLQVKRTLSVDWAAVAKRIGNEYRPPRPVAKVVSTKKRDLALTGLKLVTSRQLNANRLATISQLDDDEEILLDCILDNIAKDEVLKDPQNYALFPPEIRKIANITEISPSLLPIRVMSADDFRAKTGIKISDKDFEGLFRRLAVKARISGSFRSYLTTNSMGQLTYVELELVERPLFPDGLRVMRYGIASRRTSIPQDSKLKRVVAFKLHSPTVLLLRDGIARGRFGVLPKGLYAKRVNWPALRIARYYDLYSGNHGGVRFSYQMLLKLLGMPDVTNVDKRVHLFDRYFKLVALEINARLTKRHRGRKTVWTLTNPLLYRPKGFPKSPSAANRPVGALD